MIVITKSVVSVIPKGKQMLGFFDKGKKGKNKRACKKNRKIERKKDIWNQGGVV